MTSGNSESRIVQAPAHSSNRRKSSDTLNMVVVISSFYLYEVTREASNELIWVEPLQL